jgi:glycosyltransferase involved in cell wall biosynthesis
MHVLLDGRAILNEIDGIGRYSINLIKEIISAGENITFSVLIREDLQPELRKEFPASANLVTINMSHMSIKGFLSLGRMIDRMHADIYHSLFMFRPLFMKTRSAITIHDLMWITRPSEQASGNLMKKWIGWLFHTFFVTASVKFATKVIAVSEATKKEIAEHWNDSGIKVHVFGEGVDPSFCVKKKDDYDNSIVSMLGLPEKPYFLHVSNGKPYKNTLALLEAFSSLAKTTDVNLIIIGRKSAFSYHIEEFIKNSNLVDRIYLLGNLKNSEVVRLMQEAKAMLFPSLYEGFGLPVIEAMACGCPVMTSDRGGLKEVAGDAALLIDPASIQSMASGMKFILDNNEAMGDLRKKGIERASHFRWSKIAEEISNFYREILK